MYRKHIGLTLFLVFAMHLLALGFLVLAPEKLLVPANKPKPISVIFIQETTDTPTTHSRSEQQDKQPSIKPETIKSPAVIAKIKAAPRNNAQNLHTQQHAQQLKHKRLKHKQLAQKTNEKQQLSEKQLAQKQTAKEQAVTKRMIKKQLKKQPKKQQQAQAHQADKPIKPALVNQSMPAESAFKREMPFEGGLPFARELQMANRYTSSAVQTFNQQPLVSNKKKNSTVNNTRNNAESDTENNVKNNATAHFYKMEHATKKQQPIAETDLQDIQAGFSLDQENDLLERFLAEDMLSNDVQQGIADNTDTSSINTEAVFKHKIIPEYPRKEWINQEEGLVLLDFSIDEQGKVVEESINVISSTKANFLAATKAALLASEFYPLIKNGVAKKQSARHQAVFRRQAYLEMHKAVAKKEAVQTKEMQTNANMQRSAENGTENNAKSNTKKNNENNMEKQPEK